MNSMLDLVFTGIAESKVELVFSRVQAEVVRLEKTLSRFDPRSEIFIINQNAGESWVTVSDHLWNILLECDYYNKLSLGYFDIGLGLFKQNEKQLSLDSLKKRSAIGLSNMKFDRKRKCIRFVTNRTSLDFGAVGKGLLLREIDKILTDFNVKNCLISFGGSSILTRGSHPFGDSWPIALRKTSNYSTVFKLNDHFASFSGAIQENRTGAKSHIVHPRRLKFVENNRLAFVQSNCPVLAEVLSTSLIVADWDDFPKLCLKIKPEKAFVYKRTKTNELISKYEYN